MNKTINIALPKGRLGEKVYNLFEKLGYGCPSIHENSRKLVFEDEANGVRYFWVKPSDVAIYVETGVADVGVVGKDILLEQNPDVYELLDLGFGKCAWPLQVKRMKNFLSTELLRWQPNSPILLKSISLQKAVKLI